MILGGRVRQIRPLFTGKVLLHKGDRCLAELEWVERELEHTTEAAKRLADELGARYAVFRCETRRYEDGRSSLNADIMSLSRRADEYIRFIYDLEQRRRDLLDQLGK